MSFLRVVRFSESQQLDGHLCIIMQIKCFPSFHWTCRGLDWVEIVSKVEEIAAAADLVPTVGGSMQCWLLAEAGV